MMLLTVRGDPQKFRTRGFLTLMSSPTPLPQPVPEHASSVFQFFNVVEDFRLKVNLRLSLASMSLVVLFYFQCAFEEGDVVY
jgi:hypothetical protein